MKLNEYPLINSTFKCGCNMIIKDVGRIFVEKCEIHDEWVIENGIQKSV